MKTNYRIYRTKTPRYQIRINWPWVLDVIFNIAIWGGLFAMWYLAQAKQNG